MPAISRVLPWFRQITGETVNSLIDAVNNLTGFGTAGPVSLTSERYSYTTVALDGAISPSTPNSYVITKGSALAASLAAPAVADNGLVIMITSSTAFAHVLTATGLIQSGAGANLNTATLAAQPGAGITLMAVNGKWNVIGSVGTVTYA